MLRSFSRLFKVFWAKRKPRYRLLRAIFAFPIRLHDRLVLSPLFQVFLFSALLAESAPAACRFPPAYNAYAFLFLFLPTCSVVFALLF